MNVSPHYLLLSESSETIEPGRWRFVLRASDGSRRLVVDEVEPEARGTRLELLTVVRGLESLESPSRVTLVTRSTYIREGIRYGMPLWRTNGWRWESFGRMVPVKNADLWQRIDRALQFHRVECRVWRFDQAHGDKAKVDRNGEDSDCRAPTPAGAVLGAGSVAGNAGRILATVIEPARRIWHERIRSIWATLVKFAGFGKLLHLVRTASLANFHGKRREDVEDGRIPVAANCAGGASANQRLVGGSRTTCCRET